MSYDIGAKIDLTYLNRKHEVAMSRPKKKITEVTKQLYLVGTQFMFETTPNGLRAAIKVPVAYG
jgi:hypothetical protein